MAIHLELEIAEVEAVLKNLSGVAYAEVAQLIAKIHTQALPQAQAQQPVADAIVEAEPVDEVTEE
jgi:hypothetical protein